MFSNSSNESVSDCSSAVYSYVSDESEGPAYSLIADDEIQDDLHEDLT